MMTKRYAAMLSYGNKEDIGKLGCCNDRAAQIKKSGPYIVHDGSRIIIYGLARAAHAGVYKKSTPSFVSGLVKIFEVSTIKNI